jgi:hypothetical protein
MKPDFFNHGVEGIQANCYSCDGAMVRWCDGAMVRYCPINADYKQKSISGSMPYKQPKAALKATHKNK